MNPPVYMLKTGWQVRRREVLKTESVKMTDGLPRGEQRREGDCGERETELKTLSRLLEQ